MISVDESILNSVKLALGITTEYDAFDSQLILYINTALAVLVQTGVGLEGFAISGASSKWSDFLGEKMRALEYSKTYVIMRVRMMFDPPQSSAAMEAMKAMIAEYEWRGYVECNPVPEASSNV